MSNREKFGNRAAARKVPQELLDVASVWLPDGPFGSGRLIAPGLVLTARHVVDYPSAAPVATGWRVRLLGQRYSDVTWHGDPYTAECIWRGKDVDLALLKIGSHTPQPAFESVFSSLVEEIDGLEVTGYPQATWDTEKTARDYRVRGRLRIETVDWPFAFTVPIADVPKDVTKWKGMSGAVVVGRDPPSRMRIFGAVESVDEIFIYGKLYIARIEVAFDDPAFRDALEEALGRTPTVVAVQPPQLSDIASEVVAMRHQILHSRAIADVEAPRLIRVVSDPDATQLRATDGLEITKIYYDYLSLLDRLAADPKKSGIRVTDTTGLEQGFSNWNADIYQAIMAKFAQYAYSYRRLFGLERVGVVRTFFVDPSRIDENARFNLERILRQHIQSGIGAAVLPVTEQIPADAVGDFGLYHREVADSFTNLVRMTTSSPGPSAVIVGRSENRRLFNEFEERVHWTDSPRNGALSIASEGEMRELIEELVRLKKHLLKVVPR